MVEKKQTDGDMVLDALFSSARRTAPMPDVDFLAKLSHDMETMIPVAPAKAITPKGESFLSRFRGAFAASGLTGAAALGVWIGFVMPDTLSSLAGYQDTADGFAIGSFLPAADLAALDE